MERLQRYLQVLRHVLQQVLRGGRDLPVFRGRRGNVALGAVLVAIPLATGAAAYGALGPRSAAGAKAKPGGHRHGSHQAVAAPSTTTTVPRVAVTSSQPGSGDSGVVGTAPVSFTTSAPIDLASGTPTVSPDVHGGWAVSGNQLTFTPSGAFPPSTTVTITLPGSLRSTNGEILGQTQTLSFTTANGSELRLQQLLAQLGYLPLSWNPAGPPVSGAAAQEIAVYQPPAGSFSWKWSSPPPSLAAAWSEGSDSVMTKGAVMAFEADHGLDTDGVPGAKVWSALLTAATGPTPDVNSHGYTYSLVSKANPETLTVWHDGSVLSTSPANTGIPQTPTVDGTFPVFERLPTQIMKGTAPDGTKYADPVAWVAYFNGGDAIHYIPRSSWGYPQSFGCVEIPNQVGQTIWPDETLGSLVTVTG